MKNKKHKRIKSLISIFVLSLLLSASGCSKMINDNELNGDVNSTNQSVTNDNMIDHEQPSVEEVPDTTVTPNIAEGDTSEEDKSTDSELPQWVVIQKEKIKSENPQYSTYEEKSYVIGDCGYTIFAKTPADCTDLLDYCVDIWAYGPEHSQKIEEDAYIDPNSHGEIVIDDTNFFRYDIMYATEQMTHLYTTDKEDNFREIIFPGYLKEVNDLDLAVVVSAYDMSYSKEDDAYYGHTWKTYYFHYEDYDIVEYERQDITQEEFLQYEGAQVRIDEISAQYEKEEGVMTLEFKKNENGMLHINIKIESDNWISYYYETLKVEEKQVTVIESGQGYY